MTKHVQNYFNAFGYDESSFIACEHCGLRAIDIHHIVPRSLMGTDDVSNLIALCRDCHEKAHGPLSKWYRGVFTEKVKNRKLT